MAYNPTNWQNGDIISAERLNKIESGIESASNGSSGDYSVSFVYDTLVDGEFVSSSLGVPGLNAVDLTQEEIYDSVINAKSIRVTYDDNVYDGLTCQDSAEYKAYGAPIDVANMSVDFSDYPFVLLLDELMVMTETEGTHYIKIEAENAEVELAENFETAVDAVVKNSRHVSKKYTYNLEVSDGLPVGYEMDFTYADFYNLGEFDDVAIRLSGTSISGIFYCNLVQRPITRGDNYVFAGLSYMDLYNGGGNTYKMNYAIVSMNIYGFTVTVMPLVTSLPSSSINERTYSYENGEI